MTILEMHNEVRLRTQKIGTNINDYFFDGEIDVYLNRAINQFINDRLEPTSNSLQLGFEQSIKRIDDLRTLLVSNYTVDTEIPSINVTIENFFTDRAEYPDNFRHLISVRFKVQYSRSGVSFTLEDSPQKRTIVGEVDTDYKEEVVKGKYYQQDDIYQSLLSPFNRTSYKDPSFVVDDTGISAFTDNTFIVDKVYLTYLKEPATVLLDRDTPGNNVNCDLAEHTHGEIVSIATKKILGDIDKFGPQAQLLDLDNPE
jgi:hypothetical protein